jgi:hypothetical protein
VKGIEYESQADVILQPSAVNEPLTINLCLVNGDTLPIHAERYHMAFHPSGAQQPFPPFRLHELLGSVPNYIGRVLHHEIEQSPEMDKQRIETEACRGREKVGTYHNDPSDNSESSEQKTPDPESHIVPYEQVESLAQFVEPEQAKSESRDLKKTPVNGPQPSE